MAPTAAEKKPPQGAKKDGKDSKDSHKPGKPRNYELGSGILRFSRTRMYHKKALYKFVGKKVEAKKKPPQPRYVEKTISGEKNGSTRLVLIKKRKATYPTQDRIKKRPAKSFFSQHKRFLRSSLTPGTVVILLAGVHKGKRAVFLKQLHSGLLLVNGPFKLNGCPLRRIHQRYVIATSTKIDVSKVELPEHINDDYFKRKREKRAKKEEGDIFQTKKPGYKVTDQRKADQKQVDLQLLKAFKSHPEKKLLLSYLVNMWGLRSSQYPHRLKF